MTTDSTPDCLPFSETSSEPCRLLIIEMRDWRATMKRAPGLAFRAAIRIWAGTTCSSKLTSLTTLPCASSDRSEEHTSELQSLMRISYAAFCLKKKKNEQQHI